MEHLNTTETNNTKNHSQFPPITGMCYEAKTRMLATGDDEFMKKLLEVFNDDAMPHYAYAEALEQQGHLLEASEEYGVAYKLFPLTTWKNMALVNKHRVLERYSKGLR